MKDKSIYKDAPSYSHYYLDLIQSNDLMHELEESKKITLDTFKLISPEKENFSYQVNKWTSKEVLRHIIDTERIFAYRAFRFSRFDNTQLSGFSENDYIEKVKSINFPLADLQKEYLYVRDASIELFSKMNEEMLGFIGTANKVNFSTRALGFMIVGHNLHHIAFLKNNYL